MLRSLWNDAWIGIIKAWTHRAEARAALAATRCILTKDNADHLSDLIEEFIHIQDAPQAAVAYKNIVLAAHGVPKLALFSGHRLDFTCFKKTHPPLAHNLAQWAAGSHFEGAYINPPPPSSPSTRGCYLDRRARDKFPAGLLGSFLIQSRHVPLRFGVLTSCLS